MTTDPTKAYLLDRLYLHGDLMPEGWADTLVYHTYDERNCAKCEHLPDRFGPSCVICPSHTSATRLYKKTLRKDTLYVGLPIGGAPKLLRDLGINRARLNVIDKRTVVKARNPLCFTGTLWEGQIVNGAKTAHQQTLIRNLIPALAKHRRGVCLVSPRAGKTVLAAKVVCETKLRTLFVAADSMLLKQFLDAVEKFTDVKRKPKAAGLALTVQSYNDFDHVVCTTWQALMERHLDGARLDAIFGKFGLVIVDEAHLGASAQYFKVLNSFDAKYMLAFTGTWERKDGKEKISDLTFGRILVSEEVEALRPTVHVLETGVQSKRKKYSYYLQDVNSNAARTTFLAQKALDIVAEDPRRHLLITNKTNVGINALYRAICKAAADREDMLGALQDEGRLVTTYSGSLSKTAKKDRLSPREERYGQIQKGQFRIVVAQESMVRLGVNVPLWTDILLAAPVASKISPDPNYRQLTLRPCTPAVNKPTPRIWHVVDNCSISIGCTLSSLKKSAIPLNYDLDASAVDFLRDDGPRTATPIAKRPW